MLSKPNPAWGHLVRGNDYVCKTTNDPNKILVSGFFKMTEMFVGNKKRYTAKQTGYYDLYFSKETCELHLKHSETFIKKQTIRYEPKAA